MNIADLYVRVSTDEQANKGYSPRSQEAVLRQYCDLRNIQIRQVIHEDHSAKTFNRPEWKRLMISLRKQRNKTNLLLFTKWDRFSRNTSDAYQMITTLKKFGVEPQAVEQPLDMSVPENKMMLAIYLTAPEIENDRRGLNTFFGIRQAKKEGRWMGKAPRGYVNKAYEDGRRYIAVKEPEASIMRWAFEQLAEGIYSAEQVRLEANEKGLGLSKNNFLHLIRSPAYCGKIRVPAYKDEPEVLVKSLHEPIISEALFYKVQEVMDSRKPDMGTSIATPKDLPLRGFLKCPKCTRMLTGSASRGRSRYNVYYHCTSKCGIRYRADQVNGAFLEELTMFLPRPGYAELFVETITDAYNNVTQAIKDERRELNKQISDHNKQIDKARNLLLLDEIEAKEFRRIKDECNEKINRLEAKLTEVAVQNDEILDMKSIASDAIQNLALLDKFYDDATVQGKRYLVGLLFPEKLTFSDGVHRTTKMDEMAEIIYLKNKELRAKKIGQKPSKKSLPDKGWNTGLEPATS